MEVLLPADKLSKLKLDLEFFKGRTLTTYLQIQRLCGVLSHCSKVVRGGRTFSHRIIHLLKGLAVQRKRIKLSACFHADLQWWVALSFWFNGKAVMINRKFTVGPTLITDSSFRGYGLVIDSDWQGGWFNRDSVPSDWIEVPDRRIICLM